MSGCAPTLSNPSSLRWERFQPIKSTQTKHCVPELYFFKPFLRPLTAFPFYESPQPSQGSCAAAYTCSVNMLSGSERGRFFTARWMCKRGKMQSISSLSVARLRAVSRAITHGTSSWDVPRALCPPPHSAPDTSGSEASSGVPLQLRGPADPRTLAMAARELQRGHKPIARTPLAKGKRVLVQAPEHQSSHPFFAGAP